jgi:hypothetical protein
MRSYIIKELLKGIVTDCVRDIVSELLVPVTDHIMEIRSNLQLVTDTFNNRRGYIGEAQITAARTLGIDLTVDLVKIFPSVYSIFWLLIFKFCRFL